MTYHNDNVDLAELELFTRLSAEAARFRHSRVRAADGPVRFLIADLEFAYDHAGFAHYRTVEGDPTKGLCRWPWHHVTAGAWMLVTFLPGRPEPLVGPVTVVTAATHSEKAIAESYFDAIQLAGNPLCVSWGGEQKDVHVLRRIASEHGLALPRALIDASPRARERLDLCNAVSGQAPCPHLPEYARAVGVPTKPNASKDIGALVMASDWDAVAEQVVADVMTTAVIAVRHAIAHGMVAADLDSAEQAVCAAAAAALPASTFLAQAPIRLRMHLCQPWAARAA